MTVLSSLVSFKATHLNPPSPKGPPPLGCDGPHLVHLSVRPIAHDLDQLKYSCWILWDTEGLTH